jgi:chorismate synthase
MLRFLTAGESHGPGLVAIVEGLPAGLSLSAEAIDEDLQRRQQGYGRGERMKIEDDRVEILAGVQNGHTFGAPVALRIANRGRVGDRDDAEAPVTVPRPGHADLAGAVKYGLTDLRWVAERASARETAARVAVGAIAKTLLAHFGVRVGSYVVQIGGVQAMLPDVPFCELLAQAEGSEVRCPDPRASLEMCDAIDEAQERGDTLGGVFEVVATGVPIGLGSHVHWDGRLAGRVAQGMISIPGVKGVEIGPAFENAKRYGTEVHDPILLGDSASGCLQARLHRPSNRAGGLEGGMTNGQPVVVRAAMKPISTTLEPLPSVDLASGKPVPSQYQRSDICAVPAAAVVGEAMLAWVLAQAMVEKLGGDSMKEIVAHANRLWPDGGAES